MRTSISHLAFTDSSIASIGKIADLGVSNLEIVLSKIDKNELDSFCKNVKSLGLTIESTQSILFNSNVTDLLDPTFLDYMRNTLAVYKSIGVKTLVLGSPSQRTTHDFNRLLEVFTSLDQMLKSLDLVLCIEPNSKVYGGKYFFTVDEIVKFLTAGNFSNVRTMIDTHNLILEGVDLVKCMIKHYYSIAHVHVSEKGLSGFIDSFAHLDFAKVLKRLTYPELITYEVANSKNVVNEVKDFMRRYA